MFKQVAGPFEFHKKICQVGSGCTTPNEFTKCCVHLIFGSYVGISSEDPLVKSFTYDRDRNIDITIGLGEMHYDTAIDLCLQTMVKGEVARFEIGRRSSSLESIDRDNTKSVTKTEGPVCCILEHFDGFSSKKMCNESAGESFCILQNCDSVVSGKNNTNCKTSENNIEDSLQEVVKFENSSESSSSENITKIIGEPTKSSCFSSYLIVDITLVSFSPASDVHRLSAEEHLGRAVTLKDIGVSCFKRSDIPIAFYKFSRSLRYLLVCSMDESDMLLFDKWNLLRCQCYLNLAACQLQYEHFGPAKLNCSRCLQLDANNVKGLFRRAQASIKLDEYEDARKDLECAMAIEPYNTAVIKCLSAVENVLKTRDKKLGDAISKLFK